MQMTGPKPPVAVIGHAQYAWSKLTGIASTAPEILGAATERLLGDLQKQMLNSDSPKMPSRFRAFTSLYRLDLERNR